MDTSKLRSVFRLQNVRLQRGFRAQRDLMAASLVDDGSPIEGLQIVPLWHGTSGAENVAHIAMQGFDRMYCDKGINAYGKGCYFATRARLATRYACDCFSL